MTKHDPGDPYYRTNITNGSDIISTAVGFLGHYAKKHDDDDTLRDDLRALNNRLDGYWITVECECPECTYHQPSAHSTNGAQNPDGCTGVDHRPDCLIGFVHDIADDPMSTQP